MEVVVLIILGFASSMYGSLIGAGGGFLFVPVLLMFYNISPENAAGTGLAIVFLNAAAGLPLFLKKRRVSLRTGSFVGIGAFPGTFAGAWLVSMSSDALFNILFACLLTGLGTFLIVMDRNKSHTETGAAVEVERPSAALPINTATLAAVGCLLGIISSYFGVGGGWLLVPFLVYCFGFHIKDAAATSIFSLSLYSLAGLLPAVLYGNVEWQIVLWSSIGVLTGAQAGVLLAAKIKGAVIIRLLAIIVILMGIQFVFQNI
ncbi:sulfite exporter TauE/SafE family protein [Alteribacillus sp. HJP-4]|uniref:sulfite exporter TauE/SafE family protein n=1 Tax=Alteribacillus sp. HJP-4 TaxID=2775394 RepID=UPI0035CCD88E